MERSMGEYVKKLIEVDLKAVELADRRENEIACLEASYREELEEYNKALEKAVESGKQKRKEILNSASQEINKIQEATLTNMKKIDKRYEVIKDSLVQQLWSRMLKDFINK